MNDTHPFPLEIQLHIITVEGSKKCEKNTKVKIVRYIMYYGIST